MAAALSKTNCRRQFQLQSKQSQSAKDRWGLLRNQGRTQTSVGLNYNIAAAAPEVYCNATAAHPQQHQGKRLKPGLPDISELSPQLQQEWHPDNNALLGCLKVKPGSRKTVMWSCPNCPAGCSHIWKTSVTHRTQGTKCPYCEGKKVCEHSSLATKAPSNYSTGIRAKMPRHLSRRLLAVTSELSGSALSAAMSGKLQLHTVCRMTADVLVAITKLLEGKQSSQRLKQPNISCCVNGTMSAMPQMAFIPTTPPLAAESWCIGFAIAALRDSCTCIR